MELQKINGRGQEDGLDGHDVLPEHKEFLPQKTGVKKEAAFTDFNGKTSFGMSVFNLSNAIMGSGILGLAFAMANSGIILFIFLLIVMGILSAYSIHLLLKCAGIVGIRAYEQLGNRSFGTPGKMFTASIITVHNIGTMSSYLFIVKSELPLVILAFLGKQKSTHEWFMDGNYLIMIVSAFIILPLSVMKRLGYLGYTSGFSLSCMVFFLISVIYKKFNIPCPLGDVYNMTSIGHHRVADEVCEAKLFTANSQTAFTVPILAFAFVCHPEVLPIYTELRDATKKQMQDVANISILTMFVMYLLTALFGYLTFYGNVEPEMLHTYIRLGTQDVLILCVRVAVLIAVTLTVPLVLFPIRRALLQILYPDKPFNWPIHIGIAFGLIFVVNLLVIFIPSIRDIFGLIGATTAPSLIFILPGIFYIRIIPEEEEALLSRPKIQAACFAALGVLFMIMSLSFIFIDWASGSSQNIGGH